MKEENPVLQEFRSETDLQMLNNLNTKRKTPRKGLFLA